MTKQLGANTKSGAVLCVGPAALLSLWKAETAHTLYEVPVNTLLAPRLSLSKNVGIRVQLLCLHKRRFQVYSTYAYFNQPLLSTQAQQPALSLRDKHHLT